MVTLHLCFDLFRLELGETWGCLKNFSNAETLSLAEWAALRDHYFITNTKVETFAIGEELLADTEALVVG